MDSNKVTEVVTDGSSSLPTATAVFLFYFLFAQ